MPRFLKPVYFIIASLNSLATSFYYFYLFFFMRREFGFGNLGNLAMSAAHGFLYMFAARHAGTTQAAAPMHTSAAGAAMNVSVS